MNSTQAMQTYQDKLGFGIANRLDEGSKTLPNDITERLKAARMQALSKRKVVKVQKVAAASGYASGATLALGGDEPSMWNRVASFLPLLLLIAGLFTIVMIEDQNQASEIAEVDVELLTDELPPTAYTDTGFAQFLSVTQRD
jgi:hypothetical protein